MKTLDLNISAEDLRQQAWAGRLEQLQEVLPNRSTRSLVLNQQRRISMKAALAMIERGWIPAESFFTTGYWTSFE